MSLNKPTAITGKAVHSPAGGNTGRTAPRSGRAYVGHAVHQHKALHGTAPVSGVNLKGKFK